MHEKGIAHRDIKPDNILVDLKTQTIQLIDFGVSKRFKQFYNHQNKYDPKIIEMWTRTGNYLYCAPEIFECIAYNEKADIWSIGIVLYQMLTGKVPFLQETICETIDDITKGSLQLDQLQLNALSKDCLKRLLTKNSIKRVSASECLKHPWFYHIENQIEDHQSSFISSSPKYRQNPSGSQSINTIQEKSQEKDKHQRSNSLIQNSKSLKDKCPIKNQVQEFKQRQKYERYDSLSPLMRITKIKSQITKEIHITQKPSFPTLFYKFKRQQS